MRGIHEIDEQIKKTRHDLKKHLQRFRSKLCKRTAQRQKFFI